jgi:hypothetical protein
VFFNDPSYFESFVEPFLANKFEKGFMDYYLLQREPELLGYLDRPALLQALNSL